MRIAGREVIVKQDFDDMLEDIMAWYISQDMASYAQSFVQDLYSEMVEKIAPHPVRHAEYAWKRTPEKQYRRYIFRKKYYVIFKVLPKKLEFLAIVFSKRDLSKIDLE